MLERADYSKMKPLVVQDPSRLFSFLKYFLLVLTEEEELWPVELWKISTTTTVALEKTLRKSLQQCVKRPPPVEKYDRGEIHKGETRMFVNGDGKWIICSGI